MPDGRQGKAVVFGEEKVPLEIGSGHDPLGEKLQVFFLKSIKVSLLEVIHRCFEVQGAAHDVPWNGRLVLLGNAENLLGEKLKEGFLFYRTDREGSFWPVVAKPRSLTSRHRKGRRLASSHKALTVIECLSIERLLFRVFRFQGKVRSRPVVFG